MYQVYCDGELIHDLDSEFNVLISPTLNLELNKAPTFDFTMPPEHPLYDKIERFKSIIQVLQDGDEIFKGRAVQTQDDLYKQRYIYCEGELAYLNDTIQRPAEFHLDGLAVQRYFEKLLEVHNAQVDPDGKEEATPQYFRPGIVDIQDPNNYLYRYTNYNSTMDEMKEDLVDDYGGYLRVRNVYENNNPLGKLLYRYLDYVEIGNYGKTSEQVIEFGENLLDFTSDIDQANICTGIIPLGAILEEDNEFSSLETRLTIEDANEGVDYLVIPEAVEKYGLILQTVTWDDVTDAENLKRKGELYLEEYDYDEMTITATAVDMHLTDEQVEAFRLGDMIFCRSVPHDLDRRFPLAQMEIPLDTPENTTVTLGTYQDASLTAKTNSTASGLRNFEDFQVGNIIKSAVNQATTLINAATHGYVTIHIDEDRGCADELLIMDTPDTSTATKVWRWNLNGLGYSSKGYSPGEYATAMTMDGHILGTLIIANGMILADDSDATFGKFDNEGMKIYQQAGNDDLLSLAITQDGVSVYGPNGYREADLTMGALAFFFEGEEQGRMFAPGGAEWAIELESIRPILFDNSLYIGDTSVDADRIVRMVNKTGTLTLEILSTGQKGLYDPVKSRWLIGFNADGDTYIDAASYVAIGKPATVSGTLDVSGLITSSGNEVLTMASRANITITNGRYDVGTTTNFGSGWTIEADILFQDYATKDDLSSDFNSLSTDLSNLSNTVSGLSSDLSNFESNYATKQWVEDQLGGSSGGGYVTRDELTQDLSAYATQQWVYNQRQAITLVYGKESTSAMFSLGGGCTIDLEDVFGGNFVYYDSDKKQTDLAPNNGQSGSSLIEPTVEISDSTTWTNDRSSAPESTIKANTFSGNGLAIDASSLWNRDGDGTLAVWVQGAMLIKDGELLFDNADYKYRSDRALKKNIKALDGSEIDTVVPVSFNWKAGKGDDKKHYGYIANDVKEVLPDIVSDHADGEMAMNYMAILPLLHAKVRVLESHIAQLEKGAS